MRILLAGASGFIGQMIDAYLRDTQPQTEIIRLGRNNRSVESMNWLEVDYRCADAVANAIIRVEPDIIINSAGLINGDATALFAANAVLPFTLADVILRASKPIRLIHVGSAAEYGLPSAGTKLEETNCCMPISLYGISKLAGTQILLSKLGTSGSSVTVLRLFNIVTDKNSPNQVLGAFADRVCKFGGVFKGQTLDMGNLSAVRDFVTAGDFCEAVAWLVGNPSSHAIINIGSGIGHSVRSVLQQVNNALPTPYVIEEGDYRSATNSSNMAILGNPARLEMLLGRSVASIEPVLAEMASTILRQVGHAR